MNANVIIAVAAVAVTLFTIIFIVVEQQMGIGDEVIYYGTATGGGHSFNFAKTTAGPFVGWTEEEDGGAVLIASVPTDEDDNKFAKIVWNSDGTLNACDVEATNTQETIAEWQAAPSPDSGMGFSDPVTGVEYTYEVTEGEAPANWFMELPSADACHEAAEAAYTEGRDRFLVEAMIDAERALGTNEARMANEAYNRCTHQVANACVIVENCNFAFRGSDDWRDWKSNIIGALWSFNVKGQNMHGGFSEEFYRINNYIDSQVRNCKHDAKFIGHSLGGAMANVAHQHYGFGKVYTYGAPASFNGKSKRFNGIRLWHDCDLVPAWATAFGRHHAHGSTKVYSHCSKRSWWGKCTRHSLATTGAHWDAKSWFGGSIAAHNMDQYQSMS